MSMPCCNHRVDCGIPGNLDFDSPFANLTAETPDEFRFVSTNYGYDWIVPPIGSIWSSRFCVGTCESAISQEDADLCAARLSAILCVPPPPPDCETDPNLPECECPNGPEPCIPPPPPPCCDPPITPPYTLYYSQQVMASVECPDGTHFIYTVPAGMFVATSQIMADRMAASYGLNQARSARICLGAFTESCCAGTFYHSTMRAAGGVPPLLVQIVSGSLPPGILMTMAADARTVILSGVPTITGNYDFVLRVSDSLGRYIQKAYSITITGIENANALPDGEEGTAYSQILTASTMTIPLTWALAAGSTLPPGLTLNSASGEIFGTPTADGDYTFTIEVTDSA